MTPKIRQSQMDALRKARAPEQRQAQLKRFRDDGLQVEEDDKNDSIILY